MARSLFTLLVLGSVFGCAAEAAPAGTIDARPATFLGELDEEPEADRARIAVVRDGDYVRAYVCGKGETLTSHTRWFVGSMQDSNADIEVDGWTLHVFADGAALRGELRNAAGEFETWSAAQVDTDTTEVGLYATRETSCRGGVIVWRAQPGDACDAQGAWCDETGTRGQVTPAYCTAEELRVEAIDDGVRFELPVARVLAP